MSERKVWTEGEILTLICTNPHAVGRAMVALYNRQTESEKSTDSTRENNGRGFASCDARLGSYYARWVLAGKTLTGGHLLKARGMALKYRGQLLEVANGG